MKRFVILPMVVLPSMTSVSSQFCVTVTPKLVELEVVVVVLFMLVLVVVLVLAVSVK
jgi:hypothetical protein